MRSSVLLFLLLVCSIGALKIGAKDAHIVGGAVLQQAVYSDDLASSFVEISAEGRIIFTVNAELSGPHPTALFLTTPAAGSLSIKVNGHTQPLATVNGLVHKLHLNLRRGLNTIVLDHVDGALNLDHIQVSGAIPLSSRGATVNYYDVEAEDSEHTGSLIGPDRTLYKLPNEASGRKAVQISDDQHIDFHLHQKANAASIRFSIPDTSDGKGQIAQLRVTSGDQLERTVDVSSVFSWAYGNYPFTKNPADGLPHHFYDEVHFLFGQSLSQGSTFRVQGLTAGVTYTIDLVSFYDAPEEYQKPADVLSVLDYGADNKGIQDSTDQIQKAIDDASAKKKTLWLDAGRYLVHSRFVLNEVVVRGAGAWYTEVFTNVTYGIGFYAKRAEEGGSSGIELYDFSITGSTNVRNDNQLDSGTGGAPSRSIFQGLWIEHTKCGMWLDGPFDGLHVADTTMRNLYADGVNFHLGVTNSVVEQSNLRNLGDDGLAMWSDKQPDKKNVFKFNTIQIPVLANGAVIYGGEDNSITDNYIADTTCDGSGLQIANRFGAVHLSGKTSFSRNTVVRGGSGSRFSNAHSGGIWVWALEGDINDVVFEDTDIYDSYYTGVSIWNGNNQLSFKNVTIDSSAHVFEIYNNANAVVDVTGVVAYNITSVGLNNCVQPTSLKFIYGIGNDFPNSTKCIPFGSRAHSFRPEDNIQSIPTNNHNTMSQPQAAFLPEKHGKLQVKPTEKYTPGPGEILIRNEYVASNPVDWKIQKYGIFLTEFPTTIGSDVAGTVEAVGEGVTRFQVGDKVWSWTQYLFGGGIKAGAFQNFSVNTEKLSAKIPANIDAASASTIPLAVYTAGTGLFGALNLDRPKSADKPKVDDKTPFFYVHGGSSAVGIFAIQFAVLSGYRVVATASPRNFDLVKSYGAEFVFDYKDAQLIEKVKQATGGKKINYAYDAISEGDSVKLSLQVLDNEGELILTLPAPADLQTKTKVHSIFAGKLENPTWLADFTSEGLEKGTIRPIQPELFTGGLEQAQHVLDHHASGKVSGSKPVLKI
ncbi:coagulation factor 5/8 type domain-containing protein [Planoprotostelium fungivorum]|uniref:Coagulation factor 5/8 type domain-containing protein n=1 Tax=Planoprotostelium fungivorum TaxID=1890364 RepID=A0A2P6MSH7_9EUKA|nr:coagulation factor 5/8 type domain-containing protein [Planoprotostelium fungivorum]